MSDEFVNIKAVMSIPRYGQLTARGIIDVALRKFNMPLYTFMGVFWGQCMQRAFEAAVEEGADWVLTMDYDSVFTWRDLQALFDTLGQRADIDCLASMQPRRGGAWPLMTNGKKHDLEVEFSENGKGKIYTPVKVTTAHFGLTLLRVECIKKLKKPWFWSKPLEDGTWKEGRLDDDIYFWHIWRKAGFNIYVHPSIRIGHVEERVAYYDDDLEYRHEYVDKWRETHVKAT